MLTVTEAAIACADLGCCRCSVEVRRGTARLGFVVGPMELKEPKLAGIACRPRGRGRAQTLGVPLEVPTWANLS
jgi:hypothetical protein